MTVGRSGAKWSNRIVGMQPNSNDQKGSGLAAPSLLVDERMCAQRRILNLSLSAQNQNTEFIIITTESEY